MEDADPLVIGDPEITGREDSEAVLPEQEVVLAEVVGHTGQEGVPPLGLDHRRVADASIVVQEHWKKYKGRAAKISYKN